MIFLPSMTLFHLSVSYFLIGKVKLYTVGHLRVSLELKLRKSDTQLFWRLTILVSKNLQVVIILLFNF